MTGGPADFELSPEVGKGLLTFCKFIGTSIFMIISWVQITIIGLIFALGKFILNIWSYEMKQMGRCRIIMDRTSNEPYLERYYMFLSNRMEQFPFNIFIHKFLKSDPDDLHDHPWGFYTFILWGGYWEYIERFGKVEKHWRGIGYFHSCPATWKHRIELEPASPTCWTLFIPRKRERKWGFYKPAANEKNEWIDADQYFLEKAKES